ncbi:unnamed protein product [Adineta ricciae]|uniref:Dynein heavy chain coiled coil stalk domain-containing protein n=1 Tax=Adineta ricciae TaxID=249248 RepID=A0A815ITK3_ADIRI|nr:unnamed protein product [Adineta ricciae]CAF1553842.1 unnamed protein product [Adineta ricciae]
MFGKAKLEDLANEIFYEIFEYLDYFQSYEIFSHLNQRFQNLFTHSISPIKIHLNAISKPTFTAYYEHIILPNAHRIQSLHLSNQFIINLFLSSLSIIPKFIHLQTFVITSLPSTAIDQLFSNLSTLPHLSSLIFAFETYLRDRSYLYQQIFRLPSLKYCKFSLHKYHYSERIPFATNMFSSLTNLIVAEEFCLDDIVPLLSNVPQLHYLSIRKLSKLYTSRRISSIIPNQLTHVYLNLGDVYFDSFEPVIKFVFHHVQVLHLRTPADLSYLNANRWESLIPSYMPHLRIFDLQQHIFTNTIHGTIYLPLMEKFQSAFWLERQWFFAYHSKEVENSCEIYIYSTNPYRKRKFTLNLERRKVTGSTTREETEMQSVQHLVLQNENTFANGSTSFPNVTQLNFEQENPFEDEAYISPSFLRNFLHMERITQLKTYVSYCYLKDLTELILSLPNLEKVYLYHTGFNETNASFWKPNEMLIPMFTKNQIKDVTISIQACSFEDMKFWVHLFPRVERLTISSLNNYSLETIEYILSNVAEKTPYLHLLSFYIRNTSVFEKVKSLVQSQVIPIDSAKAGLNVLTKASITEIRSFARPPKVCETVFEGIGILFQPSKTKFEWSDAKSLMNDNFLSRLIGFDINSISETTLARLEVLLNRDECQLDRVKSTSLACYGICMWLRGIVAYGKIRQHLEQQKQIQT